MVRHRRAHLALEHLIDARPIPHGVALTEQLPGGLVTPRGRRRRSGLGLELGEVLLVGLEHVEEAAGELAHVEEVHHPEVPMTG